MKTRKKGNTLGNMQWEHVKAQRNTWLFPLLCGLIIVVSFMAVLVPQMNQIFESRDKLRTEKAELEKLVAKQAFLEDLNETELEEQIALAEKVLPSKKPVVVVIDALATELKELGLTLKTYDVAPGGIGTPSAVVADSKPGMLSSLNVAVTVEGNKENLWSWLSHLKVLTPLSSLGDVSVMLKPESALAALMGADKFGTVEALSLGGTNEDKADVKAELSLYFAYPPEVIGKITDELPPEIPDLEKTLTEMKAMVAYRTTSVDVPLEVENQRGDLFNY